MTAIRKVTSESAKCRSGRALDRVVGTRPSGLGGKSSCALSDEKGVAGEDTADVVLPAGVGATLEVIEAQLALEIFVCALGAPALLDSSGELLARHRLRQSREDVMGDGAAALLFVNEQPLFFAASVLVGHRADSKRREAGAERALAPFSPGDLPVAVLANDCGSRLDAHRVGLGSVVADDHDARVLLDVDRVVETQIAHAVAEGPGIAVSTVREHQPSRHAGFDVAANEVERNLPLGPIAHVLWDVRGTAASAIVGPALRQVKVHVDGQMHRARRHRDAYANLAIPGLSERPAVLALYPRRHAPLLGETRVVDDPIVDRFAPLHRRQ